MLPLFLLAAFSLIFSSPLPAAQQPAGATIVLPLRIVAGQPATLAVLNADGQLAPGAVVEFTGGGQVTTDSTGRATFTAPAERGVLFARFASRPPEGVSASTTIIAGPQSLPDGVALAESSRVIPLGDPFVLNGTGFRGEAEANRVVLGDQPALVLAASPVALVIQPGPRAAPGPAQLVVESAGRSPSSVPVTLVALELSADRQQFAPRQKGKLTVRLRGTDRRLMLEVRNLTPEVVKLSRGNLHRVVSSGGSENTATVKVAGRRAGDFSVSVRLIPPATGMPDTEAARQQLLAALPLAPPDWRRRVERVIRRLERQPADYLRARDDVERLLAKYPEGEFGRLLEAAWRILINR